MLCFVIVPLYLVMLLNFTFIVTPVLFIVIAAWHLAILTYILKLHLEICFCNLFWNLQLPFFSW